MVQVERLGSQIGAEIHGVDVKKLDDATFADIYRAWLDHNVVVVPGQDLAIQDFLSYSRRFGFVSPHPSKMTRHPDYPEITLLGVNKFGADGALDMAIYRRGAELPPQHAQAGLDRALDQPRAALQSQKSRQARERDLVELRALFAPVVTKTSSPRRRPPSAFADRV